MNKLTLTGPGTHGAPAAIVRALRLLATFVLALVLAGCPDNNPDIPPGVPTPAANQKGVVSIAGVQAVGETLTVTVVDADGTTSSAFFYQWAADGTDIAGATSQTYVLTSNELGATITVSVTYTDDAGFVQSAGSTPSGSVMPPLNQEGMVSIEGVPTIGEMLTATVDDEDGTVTSIIEYQWAADGIDIIGATDEIYTVVASDAGALITVSANYTDDNGFAESLISDPVGPVEANSAGTISITGDASVASTLTAEVVDGNGTAASTIAYQWAADGVDISGATSDTYVVMAGDVGASITVSANYTDDDGFAESVVSDPIGPIATPVVNVAGSVSITGDASVASTLTAVVVDDNGTTASTVTYQWAADGTDISGATSETYVVTTGDVGTSITVSANYTDDDGFAESIVSNSIGPIAAPVVNVAGTVSITGDAGVASTLTATVLDSNGTTTSSIAYQWAADGVNISGATASTYVVTAADAGGSITVSAVYIDDDGFAESIVSGPVGPVPTNVAGTVSISGEAKVDETLTAVVVDTNGTTTSTITYQWAADGTDISGATAETYVVAAGDAGTSITVSADYTDDDGFAESVVAGPVGPVPTNVAGTISISGEAKVDETLTAVVVDSNGTTTSTITYQWVADGTDISGATAETYVVAAGDAGASITVSADYTDDDGFAESVVSVAVGPVPSNVVGTISITGDAGVASTLTAVVVDGNGTTTSTITYQWAADNVDIAGATGETYVVMAGDVGALITVTASYTDDDGFAESIVSASVGPVEANSVGTISISGEAKVDETLSAVVVDNNGTTTSTITYQWAADDVDISGATASTYVVMAGDVGALITVSASYTDDGGFAEAIVSSPVGPVPANVAGTISITGDASVASTLTAVVVDGNGTTTSTITYQWAADSVDISGATAETYVVAAGDVGALITVSASYTDDDGFVESIVAGSVGPVAANVAGTISITGDAIVGSTLTAVVVDGNGTTTSTITYQWAADNVDIGGATAETYVVAAGDAGASITVSADYTDDDGFTESIGSGPVVPVPANVAGTVSITGNAVVASTLTALVVDGNGTTTSTITYQWAADSVEINGATSDTYVVAAGDAGASITVSANYTDDDGFTESAVSNPVGPVVANSAGTISISGDARVDETLTAMVVDSNGTTTSTITYQWAADSVDIGGATAETYVLMAADAGASITVSANYTDDDGFAESPVSASVGPVLANLVGTISVSGTTVVGNDLTAAVTDGNGASGTISYQWKADDVDIPGATLQVFTLTAAERGALITVTASYTDDDGFTEGPLTATADDVVFTAIVTGEMTLLVAAGAAAEGDVIGLDSEAGGDDYMDMAEILFSADSLQVRRTAGSTAVISGATCIVFDGDGIVADGLVFDVLDWINGSTCDSQGDGSVFIGGDGVTLRNSQFLGEASPRTVPGGDPYHYITLKGVGNVIERNRFEGKDMDNEGSIISIFAAPNSAPDFDPNNEDHTIQYNLFKNIIGKSGVAGSRNSTAHALQIGRSTGSDSTGDGFVKVLYNRFENVESERRIMRVQSGGNLIEGNTFIDTLGLIALEDGYASTVTKNIILSQGDDGDDGGISFAPLGHTVTDNYINNIRSTSSQRAALMLNSDPLSGSGNTSLIATPPGDFTVTVARNTIVNARQAIQFEDADCNDLAPLLDFDDNFLMNQTSGTSINGNTNGSSRDAVTDDDWVASGLGCSLDAGSTFEGNHFYSAVLSTSLTFDFNGNLAGNTVGGQDGATFTQDGNTQPFATGGLVNGDGPDAGVGVDTSMLNLIEESQVGPDSTWIAP